MDEPQRTNHRDQFRAFVGMIVLISRALAVSVEVFLHRTGTFGERYLGLQVGIAILAILFWPVLCAPRHGTQSLLAFLAMFVFLTVCVRARIALRRRRGEAQVHTHYTGTPWVMWFTGRMSEAKVKCMVEPLMVWLVAGLVMKVSPPLGGFLMVAGLGLLVSTQLTVGYERRRVLDMNDAFIDQRGVAERFRNARRD